LRVSAGQQGQERAELGRDRHLPATGYVFPDVLSVTHMSAKQIDLVSVRPVDEDGEQAGNSGSYYRCDGVNLP
jgi:hypothetical protein